MANPEKIGDILKRVFAEIEENFNNNTGGRPSDRKRKAQTLPARIPSGGKNGRMDKITSTIDSEWMVKE